MNTSDLRVIKTRENIQTQFLKCLEKRSFDDITVTMLVEHARINRTTFYRNYKDKYDLLEQMVGSVLEEFRSYIDSSFVAMRYSKASEYHPQMKAFVEYFNTRKDLLMVLWKSNLPTDVYKEMETLLKENLLSTMGKSYDIRVADDSLANLYALLFAAITMTSIHWWLTSEPGKTPIEMTSILTANIEKGLFRSMEENYV